MFRARVQVWAIIAGIYLVIHGFSLIGDYLFNKIDIPIYVDAASDTMLSSRVYNKRLGFSNMRFLQSSAENAEIIFGEDLNTPNSTEYSDFLYSPIVGFIVDEVVRESAGFSDIGNNAYKINLYEVLMGLNEGKEWKDLGINKKVLTGKIQVVIPDENSYYYRYVKELFVYTLSGDYNLAENIIDKCTKVSDIYFKMKVDIDTKDFNEEHRQYLYIGPEFMCMNDETELFVTGFGYGEGYTPIYFDTTTKLTLDMAVSQNSNEMVNSVIERMKEDEVFSELSGWRVENGVFDKNYFAQYVNCIGIEESKE